jgi:hypothetical protein
MPLEKTNTTQDDPVNAFKAKQDQDDIDNKFINLPQQVIATAGKKNIDKDAIKRRLKKEGQNYASNWEY